MKFGANTKTGEKQVITSWKTNSDASKGVFFMEFQPLEIPQLVVWNGSQRHWRSGPWDGTIFIGVEGMYSEALNGFNVVGDEEEGYVYLTFSLKKKTWFLRYFLNFVGQITENHFNEEENQWVQDWSAPQTECDFYGKCGQFGFCDLTSKPICNCLKGYEPTSSEEWYQGNWSSGCTRRTLLQCEEGNTSATDIKDTGFLKHEGMKVPDLVNRGSSRELEDCRQMCLTNCNCTAYSYKTGIGCMWWAGILIDSQKFSSDGVDLYIRVANSELDKSNNLKVIIPVTILAGLSVSLCVCIICRCMMKEQKAKTKIHMQVVTHGKGDDFRELSDYNLDPELPIFNYEKLAVATNGFCLANKLGEGGFGSVYKGMLPCGQEIAVKRLSKSSGQGTEEFKNEVVVISRLQHRNLVKLLGCCIEREEKMLIYEYMPNKSLDAFLFAKKALLDWKKCFKIIEGIGRGILYLHRDSRLRVVHRDLKPSNILLDKDLNPKISDFGMARIVGEDELQANTRRVVGTYGYMPPEYAMDGLFSEKSDVYSFGVLLLEIVTGMRNTSFHHHHESTSLIRHVWKVWNEDNTEALIDTKIYEPCFKEEIIRCIHVGLLCVQDYAKDRPTMSSVISMLTSEIISLPTPNQPAYSGRSVNSDSDSFYGGGKNCSKNIVSLTTLEGR